jgi:hypothetical protein
MACNCSKLPPLHQQARTAARAVVRVGMRAITGKDVLVSDEAFARRMFYCRQCPHVMAHNQDGLTFHRCSKCGCWLDGKYVAKARLASENCPENLWI